MSSPFDKFLTDRQPALLITCSAGAKIHLILRGRQRTLTPISTPRSRSTEES